MLVFFYVTLGLVFLFFGLRFILMISIKRKKGQPAPELEGKYGKKVRQGKRVLFYFYGPTCPPCIQMTPLVDKIKQDGLHVFKIDISKEMLIARRFGVMGTPCLVLVENNLISDFVMGPQSEQAIEEIIRV